MDGVIKEAPADVGLLDDLLAIRSQVARFD